MTLKQFIENIGEEFYEKFPHRPNAPWTADKNKVKSFTQSLPIETLEWLLEVVENMGLKDVPNYHVHRREFDANCGFNNALTSISNFIKEEIKSVKK